MVYLIKLTQNKTTKVDKEDFEMLQGQKFHFDGVYARMYIKGGKGKKVRLHNLLLNNPNKTQVDHINGDQLDNRRGNLRIVTSAQNMMNTKLHSNNKQRQKGVSRHISGLYFARICVEGTVRSLGYYRTIREAGEAYRIAAKKYFGEFARFE